MIIEFTESDILSSKVVTPAWYRVRVDDVVDKLSKGGDSTNSWLKGTMLYNADNGSKEFEGVPTPYMWFFNSKGAFAAVGFFASLGVEIKPGTRVDSSAIRGKEVDVYIENEVYNGVVQNKINHKYRAPREVVTT